MSESKRKYSYYPEFSDKDFYEKLFRKKEFNMFKIPKETREMEEICNPESYQLMPQQNFLKNYISPNTPYNAILIYHGTGVGKTCTGITIAENFKKQMKEQSQRALIIVSGDIETNFRNEIYDIQKELDKKPYERDLLVQCTGEAYKMSEDDLKYLSIKQLRRKMRSNINKNYQFMAYRKLANQIKRQTNWNGDETLITEKVKNIIKRIYSNRVIIIDEVQNIRDESEVDKMIPPIIEAMVKYSDNIKLIIMSATPMYHSPREIVYILNLMLYVDKRPPIKEEDIFDKSDNITEKGRKILIETSKGYISYLKGENPYTFPIKLTPPMARVLKEVKIDINGKPISKDKRLHKLEIIPCNMSEFQYNGYLGILEDPKNSVSHRMMMSNISYPDKKGNNISPNNSYKAIMSGSDNGKGAFVREVRRLKLRNKKIVKFKYQKHTIMNRGKVTEKPFLDEDLLANYSAKFAECLKNVKKSKGLVLIFTRYIRAGIIPFSLILEQNGFSRYEESNLLDYPKNRKGGGGKRKICYKCGNEPSNPIHHDEKLKNYHKFKQANYIAVTGSEITSYTPETATSIFNRPENMYGENVKVIIGGESIREGINFKNVRQLHILDPWHNISKLDQIIGRSIRNCSHVKLPPDERNVDVFLYGAIQPEKLRQKELLKYVETDDVRRYRLSEINHNKILKVEKILKEVAVDCVLNKNRNKCIKVEKVLTDSFGNRIKYKSTRSVKEMKKLPKGEKERPCDYKCIWQPTEKQMKEMKLDTDTYIETIRDKFIKESVNHIRYLFNLNNYYTIEAIVKKINEINNQIDLIFIYKALDTMIKNETVVTDKYNRKGFLLKKDDYIFFQPNEMTYEISPVYYKETPLTRKPESFKITHHFMKNDVATTTQEKAQNATKIKERYQQLLVSINEEVIKMYDKINKNKTINMLKYLIGLSNTNTNNSDNNNFDNELKKLLLTYVLDRLNPDKLLTVILSELISKNINSSNKTKTENKTETENKNKNKNKTETEKYILNYYQNNLLYRKNNLVGFKLDEDTSYCFNDDKKIWERCDTNLVYTTKPKVDESKIKKSKIMGDIRQIKSKIDFFILNLVGLKDVITTKKQKSKRAEIRGRVCKTFPKKDICDFINKITPKGINCEGLSKLTTKRNMGKTNLCLVLELLLRYYDYISYDKKRWFFNIIETL